MTPTKTIYSATDLLHKIETIEESVKASRGIAPTKATFEDGFAQGMRAVLATVLQLEADKRKLTHLINYLAVYSLLNEMKS